MDVDDVSAMDLGDRKEHFRKSFGAYDQPVVSPLRNQLCEVADQQARDEILQEIHSMLCHLCGVKPEN